MKPIITAVAAAAFLSGTAFAQPSGAMRAQMDRADGIVAQVNQAYGTHFIITQAASPTDAEVADIDGQAGSGAAESSARPNNPHTSWQFGPWLGRYPTGE